MKTLFKVLAFCTIAPGCGGGLDTLHIDPSILETKPEVVEATFLAVNDWCESGKPSKRYGQDDTCIDVVIAESGIEDSRLKFGKISQSSTYKAYTDCSPFQCDITLSNNPRNEWYVQDCKDTKKFDVRAYDVMLHELGHFFGYDDIPDRDDNHSEVMNIVTRDCNKAEIKHL